MTKKASSKISKFELVMISCVIVTSLRNLPMISETGLQMFFFAIVATLGFFIPASLMTAELSTGWPKLGGIAAWVEEAFGNRWGLISSWFQWCFGIISCIAKLYFIGGALSYIFSSDLASSKTFLILSQLVVIWFFTLINLRGLHTSSFISTLGFIFGILLPGLLIIFLGLTYLLKGGALQLNFSSGWNSYFPDFRHMSTLVLLLGFTRAFAGVEVASAHANKVQNPQTSYPLALLLVVIVGLSINLLGSLAVAIVIPRAEVSLISGVLEAFKVFFNYFDLLYLIPFLAALVAFGQMAGASAWFIGPVKGLLETARKGELPPFFKKVNKNDVPVSLLIIQGITLSIISTGFLLLQSLNMAFWISVALSMIIYCIMYIILMSAGICLRYKKPDLYRSFKIPFKNVGIWIVGIVGMAIMAFSIVIAFIPPAQLPADNLRQYVGLLLSFIVLITLIPFVIHRFKNPTWVKEKKE